jgi:phage repressor protein C with HTH and peptisase S24 domain
MSTRERILQYLNSKGISKYSFYKETGISNGFLDKTGAIGSDKCEIICSHYSDLNADWLITGEGSMLRNNNYKIQDPTPVVNEKKMIYKNPQGIPLIPINAMAGMFNGEIKVLECECERYIIPVFKDAEFLIPMRGSSMMPKYNNGDILACKPLPLDTFFQWNKVYVIDTDQGALAKRIKKGSDPDTLLIVSDNPEYDPFELPRSAIYHIALVVGVIRLE